MADGTQLVPIGEDVLLGTMIGVYRVARLLGIGGMGRVYKGVHPAIGSRVAIKVLSRECSDRRDLVDRFFAEARAVNLIRHEGIVNVLDLAMLPDGRPYIIMEYLDGAPLASIVEHAVQTQVPLPLGGLARLVAEVLDALGAAHAKGIVHRDLKPDNIFVAPSGRPKVLDFGIAKLSDVTNTATRTGSLLGTPHYMSPEQAAGRVVDHRADIYAIGVILFEAPPPSPRALRPDMPPDLEQVILTALAKAPEQRFSTTTAMSVALQHATAQLPPDQWRPLTAPSGQPPGSHWAPTPPASWSGRSQGQVSHAPLLPGADNVSTVSAGQVTKRPKQTSSKKGLWIAIGAVVLVGGGITAAMIGARGGGSAAVVGKGTDSPLGKEAKPDPWGAPGKEATSDPWEAPKTTPSTGPKAASSGDSNDADDADDPSNKTKHAPSRAKRPTSDPMAEALEQLDDTIDALPPEQRKRLAAYKGLSKLSPKERMKKLRELAQQNIAGASTLAEAMDPGTGEGDAWVTNHSIDPPSGYDPEHLDVTAFIPWAVAQAQKAIPDARLIRIDTNGVSADGRANLTLPSLASEHGSIDVRFISPSRGKRDPRQPLGVARHDFKCEFRVMATPEGVEMMPIDFADCSKEHVVPVPKCSFSGVWKKAIQRKAPSRNAVGNVDYRSNGGRPVWYFAIGAGFDVAFSELFADDC
jgi:serine/threonine protein kinase